MVKKANQKLKLLYLYNIMTEKTDENHGMSIPMLREELLKYGIEANRQVRKKYRDCSGG